MTKAINRKAGKKARTEDVKTSTIKQPAKSQKKQHQQKTSRRWMIALVFLCLLIGAVVLFFTPSFQGTSKEKVSKEKNFNQNKKAKESKSVRGDGGKQKKAGGKC